MNSTDSLLKELNTILSAFEQKKNTSDLRQRVLALLPAFDMLRDVGKSLIPSGLSLSARDRILSYFLAYPRIVLNEREIALVAGISEWARRVRELRIQFGWKIITGLTVKQMQVEDELSIDGICFDSLGANDYILLETEQDRDAAHRWHVANEIRKGKEGSREKILKYLKSNVGQPLTGEELRYVAKSSEWARRVRELRTEEGWPIVTKMSGNPLLPVGVYVLEKIHQAPRHDRNIPDGIRRKVLQRDNYTCMKCGWQYQLWNPSDPRFFELHHIVPHNERGKNIIENMITYCNVCHDEIHKKIK